MDRKQILRVFLDLSHSQGFYGRLLQAMQDDEVGREKLLSELEAQNFKDPVDLILYIEG